MATLRHGRRLARQYGRRGPLPARWRPALPAPDKRRLDAVVRGARARLARRRGWSPHRGTIQRRARLLGDRLSAAGEWYAVRDEPGWTMAKGPRLSPERGSALLDSVRDDLS